MPNRIADIVESTPGYEISRKIDSILSTVSQLNQVKDRINSVYAELNEIFSKTPNNGIETSSENNETNKYKDKRLGFNLVMTAMNELFTHGLGLDNEIFESIIGGINDFGLKIVDSGFKSLSSDDSNNPQDTQLYQEIVLSEILKPIEKYPGYKGKEFRTSDFVSKEAILGMIEVMWKFLPGLDLVTNIIKALTGAALNIKLEELFDSLFATNDENINGELQRTHENSWYTRKNASIEIASKAFKGEYPRTEITLNATKKMEDALAYFLQVDNTLFNRFNNYDPLKYINGVLENPGTTNPLQLLERLPKMETEFVQDVNDRVDLLIENLNARTNYLLGYYIQHEKELPSIVKLAAGGFTDGITIAGEAGTEAVISFDPAYHAQNIGYWKKAGELLGVYNTEQALINAYNHENSVAYNDLSNSAGKLLGLDNFTLGGISGNGSVIYKFGGIKFEPNIYVTGNSGSKEDIVRVIKESEHEFQDMFDEWFEIWKKRNGSEKYVNSYTQPY